MKNKYFVLILFSLFIFFSLSTILQFTLKNRNDKESDFWSEIENVDAIKIVKCFTVNNQIDSEFYIYSNSTLFLKILEIIQNGKGIDSTPKFSPDYIYVFQMIIDNEYFATASVTKELGKAAYLRVDYNKKMFLYKLSTWEDSVFNELDKILFEEIES